MTGRIHYTPEAERQLNELDDWIAKNATADVARRFVSSILEHIEGILVFPLAGRARDDVRPGMRTTTYNKRTLVAYEVESRPESSWSTSSGCSTAARTGKPRCVRTKATRRWVDDPSMRGKNVAGESSEPVDRQRRQ